MMETGKKYDIKVEGTMDNLPVLANFVESVVAGDRPRQPSGL